MVFGSFPGEPCEICGRSASIQVVLAGTRARYFCNEHLTNAFSLSEGPSTPRPPAGRTHGESTTAVFPTMNRTGGGSLINRFLGALKHS